MRTQVGCSRSVDVVRRVQRPTGWSLWCSIRDGATPCGYGLSNLCAVRRCMVPTSGSGSPASRLIARAASCASVRISIALCSPLTTTRPVRNPSIWFRSALANPNTFRSRSSFIDVMGSAHLDWPSFKKVGTGSARRVRHAA
eukprot:5382043-Prymnesium_polylepis.1